MRLAELLVNFATLRGETGPDQGFRKRKNWAALVVLTETVKAGPLTVSRLEFKVDRRRFLP